MNTTATPQRIRTAENSDDLVSFKGSYVFTYIWISIIIFVHTNDADDIDFTCQCLQKFADFCMHAYCCQ